MNIALFGATGRVGSIFLEQALQDGHSVHVLVRDAKKIQPHAKLSIITGDILDNQSVYTTLKGADLVVSCLGTDGTDSLSKGFPIILQSMYKLGLSKLSTIGTAGILQAQSEPNKYRFTTNESKRKSTRAAEEHLKVFLMLKHSHLNWTILCPTYLPTGEKVGSYRVEENVLPEAGTQISIYDTADCLYSLVSTNTYYNKRVGIAY
ncbi:hypothetical protein Q73_03320 [Bacillus coahuilensis m2-6]|uniref:NAD(P)-dependent oxidoreductase n=1 Tax=Bacillus coahuilensis TaxID=408580 RepID=UPI0001850ACF|nr:NAD(P)H-binding protein [Bacillus coahuilensis]KUP09318.1 hypothetical protein Q73_03320 [Bacillus coahuilensis m2-6]